MKRFALVCALAAILVPGVGHANYQMCFDRATVTKVWVGNVDDGTKGAYGGNAVYFMVDQHPVAYPLSGAYNMDDRRGRAMHRVLMTALAGKLRLSGWDYSGSPFCDEIDQLVIQW